MPESISLPSVLIFGVLIFFATRYFLFPRSSTRAPSAGNGPAARRVDASKVNQVSQMFPQLDRRAIAWDLSRNGGNVGATTERVLEGRSLEEVSSPVSEEHLRCAVDLLRMEDEFAETLQPPPSFRPLNLNPTTSTPSSNSASGATAQAQKPEDLISRYNLSSKLKGSEDGFEEEDQTGASKTREKEKGWASTKSERAALFAKRREEMILDARRKMEAQQRREAKGKAKEVI